MNFTREPVIETIITPKEGYKLVIRSSKGGSEEEFFVDAVEVISFGKSCFFRSLEKPKVFLVPVTDYEILEVREARMVLKKPVVEKGIKIAGGRDVVLKPARDAKEEESEQKIEKRRDRRRFRKKKEKGEEPFEEESTEKRSLIPPPSTLISGSIARYQEGVISEEEDSLEEQHEETSAVISSESEEQE